MKKLSCILCCVLALCMLLPAAWAETQEEFEMTCNGKTLAACSVHSGSKDGVVNAMIPAGTYVSVLESGDGSWVKIQFFYRGLKMTGWANVALENVQPAVAGSTPAPVYVPEEPADPSETVPVDTSGTRETDGGAFAADGSAAEEAPQASVPETPAAPETPAVPEAPAAAAAPDEIVILGTVESLVRYGSEERLVPTAGLDLGGVNVPADQAVAVIYAPKTGKVTLRAAAAQDGKAVKQCDAGLVVSVLGFEGSFTKVDVRGTVGYIRSDCLICSAATVATQGTAVLSQNGKTDGSSTINVRNAADSSSAKVAGWKTGTEVTVFSHQKGWYEIEAQGIHGWVMEKFVTVK